MELSEWAPLVSCQLLWPSGFFFFKISINEPTKLERTIEIRQRLLTLLSLSIYIGKTSWICHTPSYLGNILPLSQKNKLRKLWELRIAIYLNNQPLERTEGPFPVTWGSQQTLPAAEAYLIAVHMVRMVPRIISATNNTTSWACYQKPPEVPTLTDLFENSVPHACRERSLNGRSGDAEDLKGEAAGLLYNYLLEENSNWGTRAELTAPVSLPLWCCHFQLPLLGQDEWR